MIDVHHPAFTRAVFSFYLTHLVHHTPGFKATQLVIPHSADKWEFKTRSVLDFSV